MRRHSAKTLILLVLLASAARGDIYQWEWVDPSDHSPGQTAVEYACP